MNEIKKCSISGIAFIFEKVAYNRLNDYIESLKRAYKNSAESSEIIADIEARIAELILSAQSSSEQVVCLPLVENIIAQLGSAEDISGEQSSDEPTTDTRISRRMFRDTENGKLGGVCAGIGKYFNIDPVWVRLAIFSPLIFVPISGISHYIYWLNTLGQNLFGVLLVVYMILWFVIPEAKSAREKLEMEGEKVTAKAIAEKNAQQTGEQKAKSSLQSAVAWIGRVAVVMLKLLVALMLFPLVVACIAIIITLFVGVTGIGATLIEFGNLGNLAQIIDSFGAGVPIAAAGVALVPICVIIYLLVVLIMGYRPKWWVLITSFVVWIMLIIALCTTGSKAVLNMSGNEIERIMKSDWDEAALREPLDSTLYEKLLTDPQALDLEQ